MKYKWLNYSNNSNVIVFFNGWGMDEGVVSHLAPTDYDVLMFYDYNDLNVDFDFSVLSKYTNKYLVAWSMGVMIATLFDIEYTKKIAINGTLKPIDDKYGITKRIYDLTINGFSPKSSERFIKNMFDKECVIPTISRDWEIQKSELIALKKYEANLSYIYDKIYISKNDKIIPTKNQVAFWGITPNLKAGHAPFLLFTKWSEIL